MTNDLSDEQIRTRLAVAMGWVIDEASGMPKSIEYFPADHEGKSYIPDPLKDLNAMRLVEAVIGERGLTYEYTLALMKACDVSVPIIWDGLHRVATCPARTRALAALAVLEREPK